LNNTDLSFELSYNSRSNGLMTITLEYSDDDLTWYPYGSTTLPVSGGYDAEGTPSETLTILNENTEPLLFDSTAGITLRAKATLNGLTGDADEISSLDMVSLPKPVLNNLTLINDLDTGTILTGEIYPSTIDKNHDIFNLY